MDVLGNERRVLGGERADGRTTRGELAERIAAVENHVSRRALPSTRPRRVYLSLYSLPNLDAGAVACHADEGTVGRPPDEFLRWLDARTRDGTHGPDPRRPAW